MDSQCADPVATPDPALDDRELLYRLSTGNTAALATFYDRWSGAVHSLVFQMLGDVYEAEDVVEATFWKAWRNARRYEPDQAAVSTWLFRIARFTAIERMRALRRRPEGWLSEVELADSLVADDNPATNAEEADQRDRIHRALETLPPQQRRVAELCYLDGLTHVEIALETGAPLGTVKTRLRLALLKLRESLALLLVTTA